MGFQLAQGGGDAGLAVREAFGEDLDADLRSGGQRLDVQAEPDREERELPVLGEMVADDREAAGVPGVDVHDTGRRRGAPGYAGRGVRGHANLLGIHREGFASSVVRPSIGIAVPAGGRRMSVVVAASICQPTGVNSSSVGEPHPCE
ncbi:hypothetical protein [Streptomyces sp. NBC_00841]|uniref:hypothetical protein n=1 Tax=Streptomyces sp. NBC_00841 TaxID=2975847 RepID=UPI003FA3C47F